MTRVGLVYDDRFKLHLTGPGHPERPQRMDAIRAGLEWAGLLTSCERVPATPVELETLSAVHHPLYIERVRKACEDGEPFIDTRDSMICTQSYDVALLAAGGTVNAARAIGRGEIQRAFCAVRPPGHHAEYAESMGFCLFNNVVVAARVLQREFGLERVLILDWDVHHGNGTQHLLEQDPTTLYISLHGHPHYLYPGTGFMEERGRGAGEGFTVNVPLPPGTRDAAYRAAFEQHVSPPAESFAPQAILISAGFDAHADDPIGNLSLSDDTFAWMGRQVLGWAARHAAGRVLSVLEGGYNLDVLRRCVAEHVQLLSE